MSDPLASAFLKLQRAEYHLDSLDSEVRAFAHDEMQRLHSEPDPEARYIIPQPSWLVSPLGAADPVAATVGNLVQIRRELPPRFGLILGDFLSNLRSALDHAANGAAGADAGGFTKFPIIASGPKRQDQWRSAVKGDLEGVPMPCIALIERMQPYHGHRRGQRLLLLANLCNIDKHHVMQATKFLVYYGITSQPTPGGSTYHRDIGILGDETEVSVTFGGPYDAPKVEGGPPYQIGFSDGPGLQPRVMRVDLTVLLKEVRVIITEIRAGIAPQPAFIVVPNPPPT